MSTTKEIPRSKYRILGLIGQGQFGRVYCASHRKTGHLVALKELDRDRFPTHKFLRELRFLIGLQHPNIVMCHALEHTPTRRYLVMDYCEGGTLRGLMQEEVQLHPMQSLQLIQNVLSAMAHAHDRGVIHCDIKPENILLTVQPQGWLAKISDFGIARLNQEGRSQSSNTGSPAYMAPERFYGQYSYSSDLYAVGVLLYELLLGYRPFSGTPTELMSAHLNQPVRVPEALSESLQQVLQTALQKLPARRFRSAIEMQVAVRRSLEMLRHEDDTGWLLRPVQPLPLKPSQSLRQELLSSAVQQLVAVTGDDRLYRVFGRCVGLQSYPHGIEQDDRAELSSVRLSEPIQVLTVLPQGCVATTDRSIFWIPRHLLSLGKMQHDRSQRTDASELPTLLSQLNQDFLATIDPQGRWIATAPSALNGSTLNLWRLPKMQPIKTAIVPSALPVFQLLALSSRHVATFSHTVDPLSNACITGVQADVFTRRGDRVGSFSLPVPLRQLIRSEPYRLVASEPALASLLLIDLKPLRVQRLAIEIAPTLIAAATWGFVLASDDGQLLLLNRYGQGIGRVQGPANPTAIALLEPYWLLVATWDAGQGMLHTIDVRSLDLDIVF